jgi:hypothetical protein
MNLSDHRIGVDVFVSDVEYDYYRYPVDLHIKQIRELISEKVAKKIHEEYVRDPLNRTVKISAEVLVFTESELIQLFKAWEKKFCEKYNFANPIIFKDL